MAPIKTTLFDKLIIMNAFVLVPSSSGIASKSFKQTIVNSGSCESSSADDGRTNNCLQKRLCHA